MPLEPGKSYLWFDRNDTDATVTLFQNNQQTPLQFPNVPPATYIGTLLEVTERRPYRTKQVLIWQGVRLHNYDPLEHFLEDIPPVLGGERQGASAAQRSERASERSERQGASAAQRSERASERSDRQGASAAQRSERASERSDRQGASSERLLRLEPTGRPDAYRVIDPSTQMVLGIAAVQTMAQSLALRQQPTATWSCVWNDLLQKWEPQNMAN